MPTADWVVVRTLTSTKDANVGRCRGRKWNRLIYTRWKRFPISGVESWEVNPLWYSCDMGCFEKLERICSDEVGKALAMATHSEILKWWCKTLHIPAGSARSCQFYRSQTSGAQQNIACQLLFWWYIVCPAKTTRHRPPLYEGVSKSFRTES